MKRAYDVIVVGSRCAGSPTAMLLARLGHRVLLVDKSHFPSDTVSTHHVHQSGTAALARWGLLDRVRMSGCPPIQEIEFDIEGIRFAGTPPPSDGVGQAFSVRRRVLDAILVESAIEAGTEFRERFTVKELVFDRDRVVGIRGRTRGGGPVTDRAALVVGADGVRSTVARLARASRYRQIAPITHAYYAYWSGVPMEALEFHGRSGFGLAAAPTNDGLVMVAGAWTTREFPEIRHDLEGIYRAAIAACSGLADRVFAGRREERIVGMSRLPNFFRQAAGPGWVLVGDAGYHKDPTPAQGIADAFRDAESVAGAIHEGLTGGEMDRRLVDFGRARDRWAMPWYWWTARSAAFEPLTPTTRRWFEALAERRDLTDQWAGIWAQTVSPRAFFRDVRRVTA